MPATLRHPRRRRGVAAALGADDAVDDGHADAGEVAELHAVEDVLARRMLCLVHDDEVSGAADLDNAAVQRAPLPSRVRPQSRAGLRALLPVAKQNAISAGISPSDDSSDTIRKMPSGCTPDPAGESVPRMTRL